MGLTEALPPHSRRASFWVGAYSATEYARDRERQERGALVQLDFGFPLLRVMGVDIVVENVNKLFDDSITAQGC